jgi:hypothetical protein
MGMHFDVSVVTPNISSTSLLINSTLSEWTSPMSTTDDFNTFELSADYDSSYSKYLLLRNDTTMTSRIVKYIETAIVLNITVVNHSCFDIF